MFTLPFKKEDSRYWMFMLCGHEVIAFALLVFRNLGYTGICFHRILLLLVPWKLTEKAYCSRVTASLPHRSDH
ncbi:hypothetical protein K2173_022486 [Erythroxylum novogranatense]|uniref:Uncharacterized protein n=1 Tax=Erythroxylum novogranatense TaxID=1862640 RepID=A0AAV8THX3_9ROSI|nr:hypothetical protein K2173_022486 [Erythroxylum novogranatense]